MSRLGNGDMFIEMKMLATSQPKRWASWSEGKRSSGSVANHKHDGFKNVTILYRNSTGIYEKMSVLLQWELKNLCYTPPKCNVFWGSRTYIWHLIFRKVCINHEIKHQPHDAAGQRPAWARTSSSESVSSTATKQLVWNSLGRFILCNVDWEGDETMGDGPS